MQTEFNFNVWVNIGMAPEVASLVERLIGCLKAPIAQVTDAAAVETVQAKAEAESESELASQQQEAPAKDAPIAEAEQKPKELTEEDVRTAMHITRQRIEGEDYRENTKSEGYEKYHKMLTAQFKNIASLLGAEKPSLLTGDQRQAFITACNELRVKEDGTIGTDVPF